MYFCGKYSNMLPEFLPCSLSFEDSKSVCINFSIYEKIHDLELQKYEIAIIGVNPTLSDLFRHKFYSLSLDHFRKLSIIDLGNLKDVSDFNVANTVMHLMDLKIIPILIGSSLSHFTQMHLQCSQVLMPHRFALVSDNMSRIDDLLISHSMFLKEFYSIGIQRHLQTSDSLNSISKILYLSEFRKKLSNIEPFTRNVDAAFFDLNAIRHSDFSASHNSNPSGLFSEEASSICKYFGSGDKTKAIFISSWKTAQDTSGSNELLIAQMVWYFIEGYGLKKTDHSNHKKNLTQYIVEIKNTGIQINFYKSEISGKWWFEEPMIDMDHSNVLIPCTYDEYLNTVQEQVPDRILEYLN